VFLEVYHPAVETEETRRRVVFGADHAGADCGLSTH
jgi:hypothetical protein